MESPLVNRIANSSLITLKPETWISDHDPAVLDITPFLFHGLILKEKDFREAIASHDWTIYQGKNVCVFCSADAIIPNWAYMLVTTMLSPIASSIHFGNKASFLEQQILTFIENLKAEEYIDRQVIIKGCADEVEIGPEVYMRLSQKLQPVVKSLMFGEPCSTVPVYKRPKSNS